MKSDNFNETKHTDLVHSYFKSIENYADATVLVFLQSELQLYFRPFPFRRCVETEHELCVILFCCIGVTVQA